VFHLNTSFVLDYMTSEARLRGNNSHADSPRPEARIIYKMLNQQLLLEQSARKNSAHELD